jgi:hypothetical protein
MALSNSPEKDLSSSSVSIVAKPLVSSSKPLLTVPATAPIEVYP